MRCHFTAILTKLEKEENRQRGKLQLVPCLIEYLILLLEKVVNLSDFRSLSLWPATLVTLTKLTSHKNVFQFVCLFVCLLI